MTESRDRSIQPLAAVAGASSLGVATPSPFPSPSSRAGATPSTDAKKQADSTTAGLAPTEAALRYAVDKLNAHAVTDGQSLQLTVDTSTRQMIVVVHDAQGAVVRQIPSEDVLRLARALESGHGLVDLSA